MDRQVLQAIRHLKGNPNFGTIVGWLAGRAEASTKQAIYTSGEDGDVARGMAREDIEIMKAIEAGFNLEE